MKKFKVNEEQFTYWFEAKAYAASKPNGTQILELVSGTGSYQPIAVVQFGQVVQY